MSHYQVGDTVYLGNTAFLIEGITDTHVNLRDPTLLYPISRVERRDTFEQMLAEDTWNDALFYEREEMPSFETTVSELDTEEPRQPPLEENHSYKVQKCLDCRCISVICLAILKTEYDDKPLSAAQRFFFFRWHSRSHKVGIVMEEVMRLE